MLDKRRAVCLLVKGLRIWNKEFFDTRGLSGNIYSIQESILLAGRSKAKRIISGTGFQQPDHDVLSWNFQSSLSFIFSSSFRSQNRPVYIFKDKISLASELARVPLEFSLQVVRLCDLCLFVFYPLSTWCRRCCTSFPESLPTANALLLNHRHLLPSQHPVLIRNINNQHLTS